LFAEHLAKDARRSVEKKNLKKEKNRKTKTQPVADKLFDKCKQFSSEFPCKITFLALRLFLFFFVFLACY